MFSLRNELLQNSAFLRHNRCIELGKRYVALQLSARVKQLSPGLFRSPSSSGARNRHTCDGVYA